MDKISIGNAPCSWGTLEFEGLAGEQIPYSRMLDELKASGYTGTELGDWGYMPTDPAALKAEMVKRDLTMVGAFVDVALKYPEAHAEGAARALKVAQLLERTATLAGSNHKPYLVLADKNGSEAVRTRNAGRVTPEMGLNPQEWKTFAQGAGRVARTVLEETGLPTVFHFHSAGYIETPEEIECFLELTDSSLLNLVFDTGHFAYGAGQNDSHLVLDGLARFGSRVRYLHFKDCQPQVAAQARSEGWDYFQALGKGLFCELGQGFVDFPAIGAWLKTTNYSGWITVEQDVLPNMGTPFESARRNRAYLASIGL